MNSIMSHTNFLGIPVEGDITRGDKRADQRPLSDLEPLFRAVIEDEAIHSVGWTQYTPYFNDGDPCVFRVGEPWFKTVDDVVAISGNDASDDDAEDYDDDEEEGHGVTYGTHPTLGGRDWDWVDHKKVYRPYEGPDEARYDRCLALAEAIDSGAFENVLLEAFGDHCSVTIKAAGITVDEYSHD